MKHGLGPTEIRFYVRRGDHVDGPHPRARILQWRAEGKLPDDVLLSRDGRTWQRVRWPRPEGGGGGGDTGRRR